MEKEDKLIRDLLGDSFTERAPEGFTDSVMQSIEAVEMQRAGISPWSKLVYPLMLCCGLAAVIGIVYYFNPDFYSQMYISMSGYVIMITTQLTAMFSAVPKPEIGIQVNGFPIQIGFAVLALLLFEKLYFSKKRSVNVFMV